MFSNSDGKWSFSIETAETIPYSDSWWEKLLTLHMASPAEIEKVHFALGEYIGLKARDFMKNNRLKADFVASHGHTVLHKPEEKLTLQIGDGKRIAGHCGIPVV
ncbi:MAG: anhydro-N-acetylmuramic acid kinase, partial [Bacteroidetes bacterium]